MATKANPVLAKYSTSEKTPITKKWSFSGTITGEPADVHHFLNYITKDLPLDYDYGMLVDLDVKLVSEK